MGLGASNVAKSAELVKGGPFSWLATDVWKAALVKSAAVRTTGPSEVVTTTGCPWPALSLSFRLAKLKINKKNSISTF